MAWTSTPVRTSIWNGGGSWNYEQLVTAIGKATHTLRVQIRRNPHAQQCCATVQRWDGAQWHEVTSWHITQCEVQAVSYVMEMTPKRKAMFSRDAERMLDEAMTIIEG